MNPIVKTAIATVLLLISFQSQAIPATYTLQTGLGNDDIGGNSESFYYLTGAALISTGLSRYSIINLVGELTRNERPDNDDNSNTEIFLQGTYSYTPRAGFQVPTYSVGLRHIEEYLSEDDFDVSTTTLILSLSYRLSDRSMVVGGFKFSELDSADDTESSGYFVNFDYQYSPDWLLYTTLNIADEDIESEVAVVASSSDNPASRPHISGHHLPSEIDASPITVPGTTFTSRSSRSDNTFVTIGASYRIDAFNALDFSVNRREYDTTDGEISGTILAVDFFHRF